MFRNSVIHEIFSEFLQPLRDVGTQRVSPFYRGFIFILVLGFWLAWVTTGLAVLSSLQHVNLTQGTGWESIPLRSSLSRVSLSLNTVVVGEVDELEEDVG